jgi:hypothetical protein
MKKKYTVLLLLLSFVTFSQTLESLKIETEKMYEASYIMDFESVLNYTHPKVLEMVTREQMIEALSDSFENENFKVRLVHENPTFTFSEITKIEGKTLCLITYTNAMRMTFEKKITPENAEGLLKSFKESDEYKTLNFEQDRNSFFLEGKATMLAVAEESTKNEWKFVNYSKSSTLSKTILGEKILQSLGF